MIPRVGISDNSNEPITKYNQTERIKADPHIFRGTIVPGSVRTILNAMDEVSEQYKEFKTPYILFQAGVEKMVDPFAPLDL